MGYFQTEEEISEVSRILSLDNKTDDSDRAFHDYIKIINERMNRQNIMKLLGNKTPGNLERLNKIIKNQ